MERVFFGTLVVGIFIVFGCMTIGDGIKYGLTRASCIHQQMTPDQCYAWSHAWEKE